MKNDALRILGLALTVLMLQFCGSTAVASIAPKKGSFFIENKGQVSETEQVLFIAHQGSNSLFFRKNGVSYVKRHSGGNQSLAQHRVDLAFMGANTTVELFGKEQLPSYAAFYNNGHGASKALHYASIIYKNVYPQIDLTYYFTANGAIKYEFIVHPGANPDLIQIEYQGANEVHLDAMGSLTVSTSLGEIREAAPYSFQEEGIEIPSSYQLDGKVLSFKVGAYQPNIALIIDPYLVWSTYLGGTLGDVGTALATDSSHHLYVLGHTASNNFPKSTGAHQDTLTGNSDLFVSKFDTSGKLVWSTYFGGVEQEQSADISVSDAGKVYVLATTNSASTIPVSTGAHQKSLAGENDAFLMRLSAAGTWEWSTYFGGSKDDIGTSLQVNNLANAIYITGYTKSTDLFTSAKAYQKSLEDSTDGFIAQFDTSGSIVWSTYLGGSGQEQLNDLCLDRKGLVYVTGTSSSSDFPLEGHSYQKKRAGKFDAVIAKLSAQGKPEWTTYYGGTKNEGGAGITVSNKFKVFITGTTESHDLYINGVDTLQDTFYGGPTDAYVLSLLKNGRFSWSTYYGGNGTDEATSIDWYHSAVVISGRTNSANLRILTYQEDPLQGNKRNDFDGFMLNMDTISRGIKTSFFGGDGDDSLSDAIFYFGGQAITGSTRSTDYDTLLAFQNSGAGRTEAVVTTLCPDIFKRLGGGCRADGNTGTISADSFRANYLVQYQWQMRTEFSPWRDLVRDNVAYLPSQAFVQDVFYRRIYKAGMCQDTSLVGKFIFDATPRAGMLLADSFCAFDTLKPVNTTTIAYGNFTSHWHSKILNRSAFEVHIPLRNTRDTIIKVYLIAISDSNCASSVKKKIYIRGVHDLQFLTNQDDCNGTVYFQDTFWRRKSQRLVWNFGDGSPEKNGKKLDHDYATPGEYDVTLYGFEGPHPNCSDSFTRTITIDSALVARFSANNSCIGDSVLFKNESEHSSDSIEYKWFFGDGSHDSTTKSTEHLYSNEGVYTVRLVLRNGTNCTDSFSKEISILAAPKAIPTWVKNCNEPFVRFKTNPLEKNSNYRFIWNLGDGQSRSDSLNFRHTYDDIKRYQVEVIASIDSSSCPDTARFEVRNRSTLEARFNASILCEGDSTQFRDSSTYFGILQSRRWYFGDGDSSSKKFPRHSYQRGSYKVSLVIQSDSGCIDTFSKNLVITHKPVADFTIPAGCIGDSLQMKNESYAIGDSIVGWKWDLGSGKSSTLKNPQHRFGSEGLYEIELIVTTKNECSDTLQLSYTQPGLPSATLLGSKDVSCKGLEDGSIEVVFTDGQGTIKGQWSTTPSVSGKSISNLKAGEYSVLMTDSAGCTAVKTFEVIEPDSLKIARISDKVICEYKRTPVKAFVRGGNAPYKYQWDCSRKKCNIASPLSSEPTLSPKYNTTYTVFATDQKGCKSNTQEFTLYTLPTIQVDAGPDITGIAGREIQLNATTDTVCDFTWSPSHVFNDHELQNPLATLNTTTKLTVQASSPDRCPSSDVVTITIVKGPSFATAFTPNSDGVNDAWEIRALDLFPEAEIHIYNRWGALLFSSKGYDTPWDGTYNGNLLPGGSYYYTIDLGNGISPYTGDVTILK